MLGAIVHPYVKDVPGPQITGVNQLLQESTKQPLGVSTGSVLSSKSCVKKPLAVAGRLALLRAAVQGLRYVLCWYEGFPRTACSDQSGFPQWRTREKFPSTPSTKTSFPKRRGLCEGHSCSHPSATDLLHYGPIGHARSSWSRDYYRLLELWCLFSGLDEQEDPVFLIRLKDDDLLES